MNNITVYLGSSGQCRPVFKQIAAQSGQLIAQRNNTLIYGGMDAGLMGIIANNALKNRASVTGVIPKGLKDSERIHQYLSKTILVESLWERKLEMFQQMNAAIVLAGGFGTADEMLEVLYWAHLGSHTKPVIVVNTDGYYDDFIAFIKKQPDFDFASNLLITVDTPEQAFQCLDEWSSSTPSLQNDASDFTNFEERILEDTLEPFIIEEASIKDVYILSTALSLKQLQKHKRPIGLLNTNGQYDLFLKWIARAQKEAFITKNCTKLFSVASTMDELTEKLKLQPEIRIDLHRDKWKSNENITHE
ncbi:MAG: TIGR00730 family Rossman fold protein [Alphaproteobacteria bacterium]|nr:TIGR00730 family Rossman fold protein [Alphaproteobacteria bacterium]